MKTPVFSQPSSFVLEAGQRIGRCLFSRRLLNGEMDTELKLFLNEANQLLSGRPDYIGLAPCGSRFKGYAIDDSDFDVLLIAGDGLVVTENALGEQLKTLGKRFGKVGGGCIPFCYTSGYFEANLACPTPSPAWLYDHAVWPLLYPLRGKNSAIQRLRRLAKRKHRDCFSRWPQAALESIQRVVSSVIFHEWGLHVKVAPDGGCTVSPPIGQCPNKGGQTLEKLSERGFAKKHIQYFVEKRGRLWWERATAVLSHTA